MMEDELLRKLKEPFPPHLVKWRVGSTNSDKTSGLALAYIDAREVMRRLDQTVGCENWQNRIIPTPGGAICELGIKVDGEWVWKANTADDTQVEAIKGASSDAFKRAAVLWGIGRYLYYLPNIWFPLKQRGKSYVLDTSKGSPVLPVWALPGAKDSEGDAEESLNGISPQPVDKPVEKEELAVQGPCSLEALEAILIEVKKLEPDQRDQFKSWLKEQNLSFGKEKQGKLVDWTIGYEHLARLMGKISELKDPLEVNDG